MSCKYGMVNGLCDHMECMRVQQVLVQNLTRLDNDLDGTRLYYIEKSMDKIQTDITEIFNFLKNIEMLLKYNKDLG